jgi:hypothetical protein
MSLSDLKFVKQQANIVEVIGHFVPIKKKGVEYVGMSPFSNERTPSFYVNPVKNIFKCFSSGESGDVIDFVVKHKSISQREAIQWIRDFYNMPPKDNEWRFIPPPPRPISYIPYSTFSKTIDTGHKNYFRDWLGRVLDPVAAWGLLQAYKVGTSKHWPGACIFWQVDLQGRIRSGKIMVYNPETGKRIRSPEPLITWVHKAAKLQNFNLSICLFGEHLLNTSPPAKTVCIVESEKSAILAAAIYPKFIWLASGSLTNLSFERCKCLSGRNIRLYPDVGGEIQWEEKRKQLAELIPNASWELHPLTGNTFPKGYDLCDYILDNCL